MRLDLCSFIHPVIVAIIVVGTCVGSVLSHFNPFDNSMIAAGSVISRLSHVLS